MKKLQRDERILFIAAGILLLSIISMIVIIPGVLNDTKPRANPIGAVAGISIALIIRLVIFLGYVRIIRQNIRKEKGEYLAIGIPLIVFGLIYLDGAFAFLSHDDMLYVSILMFTSTLCDLVAGILTIIAFFLKPQKVD